jgi:hypothetical protein
MRTYNTGGGRTWKHAEPTDFRNGVPFHVLLGPCPDCGTSCFDYGGGWRCQAPYCRNNANNPAPSVGPQPDWWDSDINVFKDGNAWIAHFDNFINLQESICAYGDTPQQAVDALRREFEQWRDKTAAAVAYELPTQCSKCGPSCQCDPAWNE